MNKSALILGNADYPDSPLANPLNDARDLSKQLKSLGFKVFVETDLTRGKMREAITDYSEYVSKYPGIALFYYAGHGVQSSGINYLVPLDAQIEREWQIQDECLRADAVLRMLKSVENPANILILDACRNNPYSRAFRSGTRGLANEQYDFTGSLIAYATAPGMTASDGDGDNGLYTSELIKALQIPGLSIEEVFKLVRINVSKISGGQQIPWENSSLMGNYHFNLNDTEERMLDDALEKELREATVQTPREVSSVSRIHIDSKGNLESAFEIMDENEGRIDLELLGDFKQFKVESFGSGNHIDLSIGRKTEYVEHSFTISSSLQFEQGSSHINIESLPALDIMLKALRNISDTRVIIDGHTDFAGNAKANMNLSQARVDELKAFLIGEGISKHRIKTNAYGGSRPLNMARTEDAKAENRRVEYRVIKSSENKLMHFDNRASASSENGINELLTESYDFDLQSKQEVYLTDFLSALRGLNSEDLSSPDRVIIYLQANSSKSGSDILIGFKNSDFDDPATCLTMDALKERVDQIARSQCDSDYRIRNDRLSISQQKR